MMIIAEVETARGEEIEIEMINVAIGLNLVDHVLVHGRAHAQKAKE
jgi:hypothetical protein